MEKLIGKVKWFDTLKGWTDIGWQAIEVKTLD